MWQKAKSSYKWFVLKCKKQWFDLHLWLQKLLKRRKLKIVAEGKVKVAYCAYLCMLDQLAKHLAVLKLRKWSSKLCLIKMYIYSGRLKPSWVVVHCLGEHFAFSLHFDPIFYRSFWRHYTSKAIPSQFSVSCIWSARVKRSGECEKRKLWHVELAGAAPL